MPQYRSGRISVEANSSEVVGIGTAWLANIDPGDLLLIIDDAVSYSVAEVISDTSLNLSAPYRGESKSSAGYVIARDFTPNRGYPVPQVGDIDAIRVVGRAITMIDSDIPAGGQGARNLDDLLDVVAGNVDTGTVLTKLPDGLFGFLAPSGGGSGSVSIANMGTDGAMLYAGLAGTIHQFRRIKGQNLTIDQNTNDITITAPSPGEINTVSNLGTAGSVGVFKNKVNTVLQFLGLKAGAGVTIVPSGDDIVISATGGTSGTSSTATNDGTGVVRWFRQQTGANLGFRSVTFDTASFTTALSTDGTTYTIGFKFPTLNDLSDADTTASTLNQVLAKQSDGQWRGVTLPAAGITALLSDQTPTLGGDLNTNAKKILGVPGEFSGMVEKPKAKEYVISVSTAFQIAVSSITASTTVGTVTYAVYASDAVIGGVEGAEAGEFTGGLQGSATSTPSTTSLGTPVTVGLGSKILIKTTVTSDAADFSFTISYASA